MRLKLISLSLAAAAFAGCSQTELISDNASMQGMIDYSLYTQRGTRAVELTNANFAQFKIHSYQNIEQTGASGTFDFSAYYDETVDKSTTWAGPRPRRWPVGANDFLNFYAYSDQDNTASYTTAASTTAHSSFEYTVPATAADQQDLLVAAAFNQTEKTNQGKLNLDFKHALTQVAFKVASASPNFTVKVSKVELIRANSKGTFTYDGSAATVGVWSAQGTEVDYAFTVETPADVDNSAFVALAAAEGNLMMVPNADPKEVIVRVTYTLNADDPTDPTKVLVKEIKLEKESATAGSNQPSTTPVTPWVMGKKVTYNLTLPGRANEIIFGDATMTEDWDTTEEELETEAKDIFGVPFIALATGTQDEAGYPLTINDNRTSAGTFSLTSDVDWVLFSETENDFANATTTLASTTVTRAVTEKKVFVYTKFNNTDAKRQATITMTREGYEDVELQVEQEALTLNDLLSVSELEATEAKGSYTFTVNIPKNVVYSLTSDKAYVTLSETSALGDAKASLTDIKSDGAEKTIHVFTTTNISSVARESDITLTTTDITLPVDQSKLTVKQKKETMYVNYNDDFTGVAKTPIWAGSNVYWDNSTQKLTFAPSTDTSKSSYQGLFFRWGSLVGLSPVGEWSSNTIVFKPAEYVATISAFADIQRLDAGAETNNLTFGNSFVYRHDPAAGVGDICKYMTDKGWTPGGQKWRMPCAKEYAAKLISDYTLTGDRLESPADNGGSNRWGQYNMSGSCSVNGWTVKFPSSGRRQSSGGLGNVGVWCLYPSASYSVTANQVSILLMRNDYSTGTEKDNDMAEGNVVRCVVDQD